MEQTADKRSAMHFCGAYLTDALDMVCQAGMGKRSDIGTFYEVIMLRGYECTVSCKPLHCTE